MKNINPLMIYGIIGVALLGGAYLLYSKISSDVSDVFGGKDKKEELKAAKKLLKKLKIDWSKKFSLGDTKESINNKAGAYAQILFTNLKGYTDQKEQALIMVIFKKLKYKNDVKLVYRKFGIQQGEDLRTWIRNETMEARRKNYILGKLGSALS